MKAYRENGWLHTFMQLMKGTMIILSAFMLMGVSAQATDHWEHPDGSSLFELEGNIADEATPGDDWENVENGDSSAFSTTWDDATDGGILHDELKRSIFTGGGSKDVRDVNLWKWTHGSVPDKDEIRHAAAAAYKAGVNNDELMIFLMGDRYSTDGSAQMGVWFFQEKVSLKDDGTFIGEHKRGDVLMLAEFVQGGTKANIKLYKWNPDLKNNLELFHEGQGDETHYFIALANQVDTPAWDDYVPKSGTQGTYPENAFFEGGINLSWVFGGLDLPCFSTFLMETRSSHRVNAQLKDFVLGDLDTCKLDVTKECLSSVVNTTTYDTLDHTYEYNVTNSGFGTIDSVSFTDDAGTPGDTSDDHLITLNDVGPLAIGQTISNQYTYTSSMNPPKNTIYATGHIGAFDMATVSAEAECTKVSLSPAISVTKTCEQSLEAKAGHVVVRVDYGGMVCNDQNGTKLTNVYVRDDVTGDEYGPYVLYPENDPEEDPDNLRKQCQSFSGIHYPTETAKTCAHNSKHSNTVKATGTGALGGSEVMNTATANCDLCDGNCNEPTPDPE